MAESNPEGFADAIVGQEGRSEKSDALAVGWFLFASREQEPTVVEVCEFLNYYGLRQNSLKNSGRMRRHFIATKGFSVSNIGKISVGREVAKNFREAFGEFLCSPPFHAPDDILPGDLLEPRDRVSVGLARQINNCFAIEAYDACGTLMRRLAETKIINAFNRIGKRSSITDSKGEYVTFELLIRAIESDPSIKLERGAVASLKRLKRLGDRGAHSTKHLVQRVDVTDLAADFRAIISDVQSITHPSSAR